MKSLYILLLLCVSCSALQRSAQKQNVPAANDCTKAPTSINQKMPTKANHMQAAKPYATAKPWAYWWWLGSAVDAANITANLEDYAKAGFGGLHIIPIYGIRGEEYRHISYLSPRWVAMLRHTLREAERLGLGIDMTLGTGWPLGGSQVSAADAAQAFSIVQADGGKYQLIVNPTRQKVKRAAPGAEGWVLDHFNKAALLRYCGPFDTLFAAGDLPVRAIYNDSYEVYDANWTAGFFEAFQQRRGYDLRAHLDVLAKDTAVSDREKRIWADYHETLSDLLLEDFTKPLTEFAHRHQKILRNEAHGSPANILDLYGASDVPESEFFGSKPYAIPYHRQDPDYDPCRFGKPGEIVMKLASSAAHVTGKKWVSSETATWLGNHFKVSLQQLKPIIDESFIGGVNHIFYHGIPYSPKEAAYPGWLFYAATNFNQQSHFWAHLPHLNAYVERCQTLLQAARPDNDVLLYFPLVDMWHAVGKKSKTHALDVHTLLSDGLLNSPFGQLVSALQGTGYAFDFVSDRQLQHSYARHRTLYTESGTAYKAVVVPPVTYMPMRTLHALVRLQKAGVQVLFIQHLPTSVNGFFQVEKRQQAFQKFLKRLPNAAVCRDVPQGLVQRHIRRETLRDQGLTFLRKQTAAGTLYFITNFDTLFRQDSIVLQAAGQAVRIFNPLYATQWLSEFKRIAPQQIQLPFALAPGESVFVEVLRSAVADTPTKWPLRMRDTLALRGNWHVDFLRGDPALPERYQTDTLRSWTLAPDTLTHSFSGTARYTLSFSVPPSYIGRTGWIELGDVRESAEVRLNGQALGVAWCLPMRVPLPSSVLRANNILEIAVTNLSANRIRFLDRQGVAWKKFYDINMVDIRYQPFYAGAWPLVASGLLGPVRIVVQ